MLFLSLMTVCLIFTSGCKKFCLPKQFKSMMKKEQKKESLPSGTITESLTIDSQSAVASVGNLFFTFKEGDKDSLTFDVDDFNVPSVSVSINLEETQNFSLGTQEFSITLNTIEQPLENDPTFVVYKLSITGAKIVLSLQ